jgi:outer membrane protein assembly factor BamB
MRLWRVMLLLIAGLPLLMASALYLREWGSTRRVLWTYPNDSQGLGLLRLADGRLLLGTDNGAALLTAAGREEWVVALGENTSLFPNPPILGPGETLFVCGIWGLHCLDLRGRELWWKDLLGADTPRAAACPGGVQVGSDHQQVCFGADGAQLWERNLPPGWSCYRPPLCLPDGRSWIVALTVANSKLKPWLVQLGSHGEIDSKIALAGSPTQTLLSVQGRLLAATSTGVLCLDPQGRQIWHALAKEHIDGIAADTSGNVYVTTQLKQSKGVRIASLDPSGHLRWRRDIQFDPRHTAISVRWNPVLDDSTVYVGTARTFYGSYHPTFLSPLLRRLGQHSITYRLGTLIAVDRLSGALKWTFEAQRSLDGPIAVGPDAVYVQGEKLLYALRKD